MVLYFIHTRCDPFKMARAITAVCCSVLHSIVVALSITDLRNLGIYSVNKHLPTGQPLG